MKPTEPDSRLGAMLDWLQHEPAAAGHDPHSLAPASSDASFRRYFRIQPRDPAVSPLIVMDAPPEHENTRVFERVARLLASAGTPVPAIRAHAPDLGFMLLEDLGSLTLLAELGDAPDRADVRYREAGALLAAMQAGADPATLPPYDETLLGTELGLFDTWYLDAHLGRPASDRERSRLEGCYRMLIDAALAQPQVFVHRDWHSRNLMCVTHERLGVIDFQDAVRGPVTYDLVSMLRDAYVQWPEERTLDWAIRYWQRARDTGLPVAADFGTFYRDFELMGIQRLLKVLGIFARLDRRDGKSGYLADIPRVLAHLRPMLRRYPRAAPIEQILASRLGDEARAGYTF